METREGTGLLRILTYTVQTVADPLAHVDGCVRAISTSDEPLSTFLEAIRTALASTDPLAEDLWMESHSEATVRAFLMAVEKRLSATR